MRKVVLHHSADLVPNRQALRLFPIFIRIVDNSEKSTVASHRTADTDGQHSSSSFGKFPVIYCTIIASRADTRKQFLKLDALDDLAAPDGLLLSASDAA